MDGYSYFVVLSLLEFFGLFFLLFRSRWILVLHSFFMYVVVCVGLIWSVFFGS